MKRTTTALLALIAAIALLTLAGCPDAGPLPAGTGDPLDTLEGWWWLTGIDMGEADGDVVLYATDDTFEFLIFIDGELTGWFYDMDEQFVASSSRGTYTLGSTHITTEDTSYYDDWTMTWTDAEGDQTDPVARPYTYTNGVLSMNVDGTVYALSRMPTPAVDSDLFGEWVELDAEGDDRRIVFDEVGFFDTWIYWEVKQQDGNWGVSNGHLLLGISYDSSMDPESVKSYSLHAYTYDAGTGPEDETLTIHFPDGDVVFSRQEPS